MAKMKRITILTIHTQRWVPIRIQRNSGLITFLGIMPEENS